MSFYADYIHERTDDKVVENDHGFATYRYIISGEKKSVYIIDIFVTKEARKLGFGSVLADSIAMIAKSDGCVEMLGTVNPKAKGSTNSIKALLGYGFELLSSSSDAIILRKDI